MIDTVLSQRLAAANAPLENTEMNHTMGSGQPRFELYHFALSVCSQKVRTCLAEKSVPYVARDINLQMPQLANYDPAYVRLRLMGRSGQQYANQYTGRSSTQTEGFDPAVVPTLVDLKEERVYVDSLAICKQVAGTGEVDPSLIPAHLTQSVQSEMAIVDGTPHVAMLYGAHPDIDFRPERLRQNMPGIHDRKIEKIRAARSRASDDAILVAAFDAKIRKEQAGKSFVATAAKMRDAVNEVNDIVGRLGERLKDDRRWICGDTFTLADIFWAVSLFRLEWLGMAFCWQGNHPLNHQAQLRVEAYAARLFRRPSFRDAVIDWPGIARTEYVSHHYND